MLSVRDMLWTPRPGPKFGGSPASRRVMGTANRRESGNEGYAVLRAVRTMRSAVAVGLIAALTAACGVGSLGSASPSGSTAVASTVEVALEAPLSGDQASNGQDMLAGAQLAVDELNASGGVSGKQISLVPADDRADPATGMQVAQTMVARHVFAVVGPYNSAVGIKNLKTYLDAGTVVIHLTSNSATNGMGITIQPKDFQIAPVEAKAISQF